MRLPAGRVTWKCQSRAKQRVVELKQQLNDDPGADHRRREAARVRAAKEREARIQAALDRLPEQGEIKRRQGKKPEDAPASTTDPDATVMKRGDGGFRPAYNLQYGTDRKPDHRSGPMWPPRGATKANGCRCANK